MLELQQSIRIAPPNPNPPIVTSTNFYVAEDGTTFYVAEDGATSYVQES